jgi:hypothetical protein
LGKKFCAARARSHGTPSGPALRPGHTTPPVRPRQDAPDAEIQRRGKSTYTQRKRNHRLRLRNGPNLGSAPDSPSPSSQRRPRCLLPAVHDAGALLLSWLRSAMLAFSGGCAVEQTRCFFRAVGTPRRVHLGGVAPMVPCDLAAPICFPVVGLLPT